MRTALLIAGKDLRQRLRDRSAFLVALVIPFALAAILGVTLSDVSSGRVSFRFGLVELDRGQRASFFAEHLLGGIEREGLARIRRAPTVAAGRRLADDGTVAATFVVPPGFSAAVARGAETRIDVIGNPDEPIGTLVARAVAQAYANELNAIRVAVAADARAGGRASPAEVARGVVALTSPIVIADVTADRRELDATTFYAAGMAVFFLFFTVQFGVSTLLDERRDGTLARLLAAPIPRSAILGGKAVTSLALGVVSMTALAVATSVLLDAHWGNPVGVGLLIVAGVLAATSVTALVATLARTPDQASSWQSIVALVLGMLGGSFFPVYQAGGWLESISLATPHAWFLRGLGDLAGGGSPSTALVPAAAIVAFAAVTGAVALLRLGRLLER